MAGEFDRRQNLDGGELSLTMDEKMEMHLETAWMFASLGTLPASLFDNQIYINWVHKVSKETYMPPNSRFLDHDGPAMSLFEDELMTAQVEELKVAAEYYKGVPFAHITFDAWTSRAGYPYIGECCTEYSCDRY